ncbi:shikimate kinase [Flaviflexus equikiangi]|uniref:Shikimate kinase n=1 Tax=Flaviflexus equikiangi TaxID=2758573 RepID=A0ABS2THS2_9ACTO|nr:shikimate kinase [Flaviflexus equikiangi]MBM9434200.1 hypothetical protein [Flaviflexus equikiangi]
MIILVGPPGNGVDEIVRVLDGRGLTITQSTDLVEEREGMSLADIAITRGPAHYAQAEQDAALAALSAPCDVVVLGSGALGNREGDDRGRAVRERVAELVAEGATKVFLTAGAKELMNRSGLNVPRSLAIGSPRSMYLTQLKDRTPLYEEHATTLDTSSGDWEALADRLV